MSDTRPEMTRAQFEAAAAYAYDDYWLTGEDAFLHVPAVMQVEGWNLFGHVGHNRLTEPQRILMMWSNFVGQTSNGGFTQFVGNYEYALEFAYPHIQKLGWPKLFERFDLAFREQAGDPQCPKLKQSEPDDWPAKRAQIIEYRAKASTRFRPWAKARAVEALDNVPDMNLSIWYYQAVASGEITEYKDPDFVMPFLETDLVHAFDDWFYLDETRKDSKQFIGHYIRRNRDDLCRLID